MKLTLLCSFVLAAAAIVSSTYAGDFKAYHVGNSLTGDLMSGFKYSGSTYVNASGGTYTWGTHFRPSTSLTFMYANPYDTISTASVTGTNTNYSWHTNVTGDPNKDGSFKPWSVSLPGEHWDAVTLQPWQDNTANATLAGHITAINGMITASKTGNPADVSNASTRFFIYAAWPQVYTDASDSTGYRPFKNDFLATTANPTNPNRLDTPTREYYNTLTTSVRATNPTVGVIPAGEVLLALDNKMRLGQIPGFTSIKDIHRDAIHLNAFGANIVGYTAYATLFKQSPVGLADPLRDVPGDPTYNLAYVPAAPYSAANPSSEALAIIQQTVWDVVNEQSAYTNVPEPVGLGLLSVCGAAMLRRRRREPEGKPLASGWCKSEH